MLGRVAKEGIFGLLCIVMPLPAIFLITEFTGNVLMSKDPGDWGAYDTCHGSEAFFYARVYSHMFIFPWLFGTFGLAFLWKPYVCAIDWVRNRMHPRFPILLGTLYTLVLCSAYINEFVSPILAPWSYDPA